MKKKYYGKHLAQLSHTSIIGTYLFKSGIGGVLRYVVGFGSIFPKRCMEFFYPAINGKMSSTGRVKTSPKTYTIEH